jgi:DNA-binding PadR family transcriptional regulator
MRGAPGGLLTYFILHKLATKPSYGYEIIQSVEETTGGAWKPGAGSVYPLLKKLHEKEYITELGAKGRRKGLHLYGITRLGLERLKDCSEIFARMSTKWTSLRYIVADLLDPSHLDEFIVNGSKAQFEIVRRVLGTKLRQIPDDEASYILGEYALELEHQLKWVISKSHDFQTVRPSLPKTTAIDRHERAKASTGLKEPNRNVPARQEHDLRAHGDVPRTS